jgi:hypothetical protein
VTAVMIQEAALPLGAMECRRPIWNRAGHKASKRFKAAGMRLGMLVKSCYASPATD